MSASITSDSGYRSFTATNAEIGANIRVKLDSDGKISAAGATDQWIGTTLALVPANGTGTVRLRNTPGEPLFVAGNAITAGGRLFSAADGKVDDAATGGAYTGFQAGEAAAQGAAFRAVPSDLVTSTAGAAQAVATDPASTQALANALRTACIAAGIIKGAA